MNAIATSKSPRQNRLEGFALTAIFLAFPTYAGLALGLKLIGDHAIVGDRWGAAIFVAIATFFHAMLKPWLAPKFPKVIRHGCEPLFFDADLSFSEKIAQWRMQPKASVELVSNLLIMSLVALAATSIC